MRTPYLLIARVLKPQGVHGEAKLRCDASDEALFAACRTLYRREGDSYLPVPVRISRVQGGYAYACLADCASPEDVEKWRDTDLYIDRAHAAPLAEGEYYLCDLIGCRVVTTSGEELGELRDVLQYGAADIYVIRAAGGEWMAPALPDVFVETDIDANRIVADPARFAEVAVMNR